MGDSFDKALETYKFLDAAANTIKGRTWTISAWVLSASGAVLAFLVNQLQADTVDVGFVLTGAVAGFSLTVFAIVLVLDQAAHLQSYWAQQDRARDSSPEFREIIAHNAKEEGSGGDVISHVLMLLPGQRKVLLRTGKPFPRFCSRILMLLLLYSLAFLIIGVYAVSRY